MRWVIILVIETSMLVGVSVDVTGLIELECEVGKFRWVDDWRKSMS